MWTSCGKEWKKWKEFFIFRLEERKKRNKKKGYPQKIKNVEKKEKDY